MKTWLRREVEVIEHQHDRLVDLTQFVDELRDHQTHRIHTGCAKRLVLGGHESGVDRPESGNDVGPEDGCIVVAVFETKECERSSVCLGFEPRGQQRCLPPPGGSADQDELPG